MAHTGKLYQLAFRRDLRMQVFNNQFAYPERFRVSASGCLGVIGAWMNTHPVVCGSPTFLPMTGQLDWDSGLITTAPINFRAIVTCSMDGTQSNVVTWRAETAGGVIFFQEQIINLGKPVPSSNWIFPNSAVSTPGVFTKNAFSSTAVGPVMW